MNQYPSSYHGEDNIQIMHGLLDSMSFMYLSKDFRHKLFAFLEIGEIRSLPIVVAAKKFMEIYHQFSGNFEQYFVPPRIYMTTQEIKQFSWKVFKKYDEQLKNRHLYNNNSNRPFIREAQFTDTLPGNHNNMNMVNMFLNVPELNTAEEMQMFQRKMFEVFKKAMPSVTSSLNYVRKSMQSSGYRFNQFNSERFQQQNTPRFHFGMNHMPNLASSASSNSQKFIKNPYFMNKPYQNFEKFYTNFPKTAEQSPSFFNKNFRPYQSKQYNPQFKQMPHSKQPRYPQSYSQPFIYHDSDEKFDYSFSQRQIQSHGAPYNFNMSQNSNGNRYDQHGTEEEKNYSFPRKMWKKDDQVSIFAQQQVNDQHPEYNPSQINKCQCSLNQGRGNLCILCKIKKYDLYHDITSVITISVLRTDMQSIKLKPIDMKILSQLKANKQEDIQIRCFELPSQNSQFSKINWPQNYQLFINKNIHRKISEFQNQSLQLSSLIDKILQNNSQKSSLCQIQLKKMDLEKQNHGLEPKSYILQVLSIRKRSVQQLKEILVKNYMKIRNINQIKEGSILISPIDPISKQIMIQPVRGNLCHHPQCFELIQFLQNNTHSFAWKCPICQHTIQQFSKDPVFQEILAKIRLMISPPKLIKIDKNGNFEAIQENTWKNNQKQSKNISDQQSKLTDKLENKKSINQ